MMVLANLLRVILAALWTMVVGIPLLVPTAIAGSYAALAKVPWWQLHPGRQIEISFLAPIAPPSQPEPSANGRAVESLMNLTRDRVAGSLAALGS